MKRYIKSAKTIEDYENMGVFNDDQMFEIREGLEDGLDVSVYADPKYDGHQMSRIRWGLEDGLDISMYADPKYDDNQMAQIRWGLEEGLDVSVYANPKYDSTNMAQIRKKLEDENKKPAKSSRINWKSFVNKLEQEANNNIGISNILKRLFIDINYSIYLFVNIKKDKKF